MTVETLTCIAGKIGEVRETHAWIRGTVHRVCPLCGFIEFAFTIPPACPIGATPEWAWYYYGPTQAPI